MLLSSELLTLNKSALISRHSDFSYAHFGCLVEKNNQTIASINGCRVSIDCNESFSTAVLLCILEGRVSSILLLPSDLSEQQKVDFENASNTEFRLDYADETIVVKPINALSEVNSRNDTTQWIVPTSGTTGLPKLVVHSTHSLTRSLKRDDVKGRSIIWGMCYEISRFAGLQVFLQGLLTGSTLCFAGDNATLTQKIDFFIEQDVNSISATPSFWRQLLIHPKASMLTLKNITLGGEIADQNILNALSIQFPDSRITQIYASTEAGVGFSVTDKLAGFPSRFVSEGLADMILRVEAGKLFVKHTKMDQYYLTKSTLIQLDGFIDTGDLVEVNADRIHFLGRESGCINVGGNKIHPEEVEAVLLEHANVARCRVYAKSSSIIGNLVSAEIQMVDKTQNFKQLKKELTQLCSAKLAKYKVPRLLSRVEQVELNAMGKIIR